MLKNANFYYFSLNRFLFVLLGPPGKTKSYNEIGRAIATLMVDDVSTQKCINSQIKCKDIISANLHKQQGGQMLSSTRL